MHAKRLLEEIQMLDFTLQDVSLYLDLHPHDEDARTFYKNVKKQLMLHVKEYERNYSAFTNRSVFSNDVDCYVKDAWPWEKGGC